jgi:hypothetical protein
MDAVRQWGRAASSRLPLPGFPYPQAALGLALFVLVVAHQFGLAAQTQAFAIRQALTGAAASMAALPVTATADNVRAALRHYFPGPDMAIDPSRFPSEVDVTVGALDRRVRLEARSIAQRIVGAVVVQLDGYGSSGACGDRNAMTWRILP